MRLKILCLMFVLIAGSSVHAIEKKDSLFLNLLKPENISLYDNFNYELYIYEGFNLIFQDSLETGISNLVKGLNLLNRNNNMERMHDYQSQEFFQLLQLAVDDKAHIAQKEILLDFFGKSLKGDLNGVDKLITKKWAKSSHPETSLRLLVFVSKIKNNSKETNKYLSELLLNFPSIFTANLLKAEMFYDERKWIKSKFYFSRAIKLNSASSFAFYKRGLCNKKLDLIDAAKKDLRTAIKLSTTYVDAWNEIGRIYGDSNQYKKAITAYRKAIEINPFYMWSHANLGLTYSRKEMKDSALYFYNKALELNPNSAKYYNNKGDVYYKFKNYNEALYNYTKALVLNPAKDIYWKDRGMAYFNVKDWDLAIKDFSKAYELDNQYEYVVKKIGDCYLESQKWRKAIEYFDKAIEIDPNYTNAISDRGYCYLQLNEYENALKDYNRLIEIKPLWVFSWLYRADCWVKLKNYQEAKNDLLKAIDTDPENSTGYGNLGWVYYCLDEFEKSIEFSNKAIEFEDVGFYAKFNLALATLRMGDTEKANEMYHTYYNEAKNDEFAISGAVQDLKILIDKKVLVKESSYVIQEIFYLNL